MPQVAVGLWTRDTHDYSISARETLSDLEKAVAMTRNWATQMGCLPDPGKLKSIFVAPEFLFTWRRDKGDHSGTTARSKTDRDVILDHVLKMAEKSPSMLLVPGTIVFRETYGEVESAWKTKKSTDPATADPFAKTKRNLAQAANPVPINDPGKKLPAWAKTPQQISEQLAKMRKPYSTKEAPESEQNTEGYRKFYNNQIAELTEAEKLMIAGNAKKIEEYFLIKNRTYVFFDKKKVFSYGKKSNMGDYAEDEAKGIFVPGRKEGITTIDGLKIGFEVCMDHDAGILFDHMGGAAGRTLDLHVICSAEVPNSQSKCMAKPGGFLVHASTGAGGQDHTGVFKQGKGANWDKVETYPAAGDFGGQLRVCVINVSA
jgi:hypothetical protein